MAIHGDGRNAEIDQRECNPIVGHHNVLQFDVAIRDEETVHRGHRCNELRTHTQGSEANVQRRE